SLSLSVGNGSSGRSGGRFILMPGLRICAWPSRDTVLDCITDSVHRAHDVGSELATNRADMRIDGALSRGDLVAPDLAEELLPARDPAGSRGQVLQQIELDRGEVNELA